MTPLFIAIGAFAGIAALAIALAVRSRRPNLFRYHTGTMTAYADPIAVYRRLWIECGQNPQELLESSECGNPALAMPSTEKLLTAVRRTFRLAPFDPANGSGASDEHVYAVLDRFCDFLAEKKKRHASSLT